MAYYNEWDAYTAQWLRNLIAHDLLPLGEVDERSIEKVQPEELKEFTQCHFFAGVGGWPLAARMAGWQDERSIWTGSPPCQPFSTAGKQKGTKDKRDLWPQFFRLIRAKRPPVVMGEQVAAAIKHGWLDRMHDDLEKISYSVRARVIPACSVNAPHLRKRLWFVGSRLASDTARAKKARHVRASGGTEFISNFECDRRNGARLSNEQQQGLPNDSGHRWAKSHWSDSEIRTCADGKARRVKPGVCFLVDGFAYRVPAIKAAGNAIVPQVAAEVIKAFMLCRP